MVSFQRGASTGGAAGAPGVAEEVRRGRAARSVGQLVARRHARGSASPAKRKARLEARLGWEPGTLIADRYRLDHLIGMGACAEVWRAEHIMLQAPAAVKLLSEARRERTEELEGRFMREARATVQLRSPHIVRVLDFGMQEDCAYIAMELLEGESLRQRLDRVGRLTPEQTARIVSQLAAGLEVAHEAGIVHRDLKPSNIFLARDGDTEVVKIVDFGIAKRTHFAGVDQLATQKGVLIGTPSYASPEQILEASEVDARSDLWQVAVVAFECLCGTRPFHASSVGQLMMHIVSDRPPPPSTVASVPPGFDEWFARATAAAPAHRFESARQLADALCAVLTPGKTSATWADCRPSYHPPPLRPMPEAEESTTVPVDDLHLLSPSRVVSSTATFEVPDLRPRGRRPALVVASALALAALVALLSVDSSPAPALEARAEPATVMAAREPAAVPVAALAPTAPAASNERRDDTPAERPTRRSVRQRSRRIVPRRLPAAAPPPRATTPSRRAEEALGI